MWWFCNPRRISLKAAKSVRNRVKSNPTAIQLKITFYDASYAYFAKAKELRLITEDLRLIKKIAPTINASTLDDI